MEDSKVIIVEQSLLVNLLGILKYFIRLNCLKYKNSFKYIFGVTEVLQVISRPLK